MTKPMNYLEELAALTEKIRVVARQKVESEKGEDTPVHFDPQTGISLTLIWEPQTPAKPKDEPA